MTNTTDKSCIACGMAIQSQAKKCQHCRTWQTKWSLTAVKPAFPLLFILFFVVLFGGMTYDVYNSIYKDQASFPEYKDSIVVVNSNYNFAERGDCTYITSIGHLKNNSNVPWEYLRIEVQFFNQSGELIDTISDRNYGLFLPPNTEVAFRVRARPQENRNNMLIIKS